MRLLISVCSLQSPLPIFFKWGSKIVFNTSQNLQTYLSQSKHVSTIALCHIGGLAHIPVFDGVGNLVHAKVTTVPRDGPGAEFLLLDNSSFTVHSSASIFFGGVRPK